MKARCGRKSGATKARRDQIGIGDRLDILTEFRAIIIRAPSQERVFRLRLSGRAYRATLTSFGRLVVRDGSGALIIASELGWVFEVCAVRRRCRRRHGK